MLFHVVPNFLNSFDNITDVKIKSIVMPEFNIKITEDKLNQGRPYPNKHYVVGMFNSGRKAMIGMLFDLGDLHLNKFTVLIEWSGMVNNKPFSNTHTIINHVENSDLKDGLITHDAKFWHGYKDYKPMWPSKHANQSPIEISPCFNVPQFGLSDQVSEITLPVLEVGRLEDYASFCDDRIGKDVYLVKQ